MIRRWIVRILGVPDAAEARRSARDHARSTKQLVRRLAKRSFKDADRDLNVTRINDRQPPTGYISEYYERLPSMDDEKPPKESVPQQG
jgi:hypothetical protein